MFDYLLKIICHFHRWHLSLRNVWHQSGKPEPNLIKFIWNIFSLRSKTVLILPWSFFLATSSGWWKYVGFQTMFLFKTRFKATLNSLTKFNANFRLHMLTYYGSVDVVLFFTLDNKTYLDRQFCQKFLFKNTWGGLLHIVFNDTWIDKMETCS